MKIKIENRNLKLKTENKNWKLKNIKLQSKMWKHITGSRKHSITLTGRLSIVYSLTLKSWSLEQGQAPWEYIPKSVYISISPEMEVSNL